MGITFQRQYLHTMEFNLLLSAILKAKRIQFEFKGPV